MENILPAVILNPVTLVDCVVAPVGGMANIELEQEAAVQRAGWVNGDGITESNSCEAPLAGIIGTK